MTGTSTTGASAVLRGTAAAGLSLALAWGLTSCAGDGAGAGEPTAGASADPSATSASASPTSTPTPTPSATYSPASAAGPAQNVPLPVMPDIAREKSKEGLEAFARYFYELVNYAVTTGDLELLRAVSGPNCVACNFVIRQVTSGYQGDDWMAGAQVEVYGTQLQYFNEEENSYQVLIEMQQGPIQYYGPAGLQGTHSGDEYPYAQLMKGAYSDGNWIADEVVTVGR